MSEDTAIGFGLALFTIVLIVLLIIVGQNCDSARNCAISCYGAMASYTEQYQGSTRVPICTCDLNARADK